MSKLIQQKGLLWVSVAVWLVCLPSFSKGSLRVGYVDLHKALQSVEAGRKAKVMLDKELAAKKLELEKEQGKLQKEAEAFEKKAAIMSESARAAKQAGLQKKFVAFQKRMAESQASLQRKEQELTQPIVEELKTIIEGVGKQGKYELILEKNGGGVLYAANGSDLTDAVIGKFNKKKRKKRKK